jgi:hypothetical protein
MDPEPSNAAPRRVLRVYSEMLPYEALLEPRTLRLLAAYEIELVLAVRPWDVARLPEVARALRDIGVPLSVWPMLADDAGRWASVHNAAAFAELVRAICDTLEAAAAPAVDVLFDLEPPFQQAKGLADLGAGNALKATLVEPDRLSRIAAGLGRNRGRDEAAAALLARAVKELDARGLATSIAVWPLVALDPPGRRSWQSLLGTPVDELEASHVSVMMYTTILEGWSRGTLRRGDTQALLAAATARAVRRWGDRAGISLGCVGTGAFADEPVYRTPRELAEDVAIARAAGATKLSLFDLAGVLAREPAEAWLDAFVHGSPEPKGALRDGPNAGDLERRIRIEVGSWRVRAARTLARAATSALGRWR